MQKNIPQISLPELAEHVISSATSKLRIFVSFLQPLANSKQHELKDW